MTPYPQCFSDDAQPPATIAEAKLVAELAARLIEWSETQSRYRVALWLKRVCSMLDARPDAGWTYLELQSADISKLSKSYEEIGDSRGVSKQGVCKAHHETMRQLSVTAPMLAKAINQVEAAHSHSDIDDSLPGAVEAYISGRVTGDIKAGDSSHSVEG